MEHSCMVLVSLMDLYKYTHNQEVLSWMEESQEVHQEATLETDLYMATEF